MFFLFLWYPPPPPSTLFPYTTLFRSKGDFTALWQPVPKGVPAREVLVYLCASVSLASGIGLLWRHTAALADRKSTRLNSSHLGISYAVFCLKKKKQLS